MFSSVNVLMLVWLQLLWLLLPAGLLVALDYWLYQSLDRRVNLVAMLLVLLLLCCEFCQWLPGS